MSEETKQPAAKIESLPEQELAADGADEVKGGIIIHFRSSTTSTPSSSAGDFTGGVNVSAGDLSG